MSRDSGRSSNPCSCVDTRAWPVGKGTWVWHVGFDLSGPSE